MVKFLFALFMLFLVAGFDEPYTPPELLARAPALPQGYDASKAIKLDLTEAFSIAMKHNLGIKLERQALQATELTVRSAGWVMSEPTVSASYASNNTWSVTASSTLPTGTQVSLGVNEGVSLSVTQPLFRGFSFDLAIPRYAILTAQIASKQERLQLALTATAVIRETEAAYWDVVYALYSYNVTIKSKQLAEDTVDLVRRQIAAGMVPSSDLIGAENTFAQRRVAVLGAAQNVERAWDALRTILDLPRDQWTRPLIPLDRPRFEQGVTPGIDDAFAVATRQRVELAQLDLEGESIDLAIRKAKNDELPQIDVGFTASLADPTASGNMFPGFTAMATLTWTPMSRGTKTATALARLRRERHVTTREQRVQGIWNEVRASVRDQEAAALEVVAASQSRKLAIASLAVENQKYLSGESSNLDLAQLQAGLASAELTELQALIAHEKAESAVLLATGQLLEKRGIDMRVMHDRR